MMKRYRKELEEITTILASDGLVQIDYLKSLHPEIYLDADELALTFGDLAQRLDAESAACRISADAIVQLQAVDDMLEKMSGEHHAHLWSRTALTAAPEWEEVRQAAKLALSLLVQQSPGSGPHH